MKKLRLYTLDDYNKGLKPTCTREGQKIDFIKRYSNNLFKGSYEFACLLEDGAIIRNTLKGEYKSGQESTYDLMIEEDYQVGDWVITEGYSPDYDGKALRITGITRIDDFGVASFEQSKHMIRGCSLSMSMISRLATEEEIAEAKKLLEPEYVPFEWEDRDQLRGKWVKNKSSNWECQIVIINNDPGYLDTNVATSKTLLDKYTFLDGTPVGKIKK